MPGRVEGRVEATAVVAATNAATWEEAAAGSLVAGKKEARTERVEAKAVEAASVVVAEVMASVAVEVNVAGLRVKGAYKRHSQSRRNLCSDC